MWHSFKTTGICNLFLLMTTFYQKSVLELSPVKQKSTRHGCS